MADGSFPGLVSKDRNVNAVTNPIWVNLTDGTNAYPVGGGTEATALRVTIANDSTGVLSIDDNGGSITVDGTVSVSGTVTVASAYAVDDAAGGTDNVMVAGVVRDDALTTLTPADGDYTTLRTDSTGALWIATDDTINVNVVSGGLTTGEVHDYDTASAVASDATDNHDYTVTGAGSNSTFLLQSVIVSGSGNIKFEVQTGPVAGLSTVAVGFLTGRQGDTKQIFFDPGVEVPVASTGTVRIIRTNRQGAATDLYSTIIGQEI